jgi:arylsulfatase
MGHFPNLPSQQFKGKSRIGNYGDKLMEGDYHVGEILDTLKQLGIDDNTIVVFASDNGPQGQTAREHGNQGTPDMGNSGPFRGELGEVTEGAIRTAAIIRWPGKVKPTQPHTPCSRLWNSCRPSLTLSAARRQRTDRLTASIKSTPCSAAQP